MQALSRTTFATVFASVLLLFPLGALAATLNVPQTSVAGIGFSVSVDGTKPSTSVSLSVHVPAGGAFELVAVSDSAGNVTIDVPGTKIQRAGAYTLNATTNGESLGVATVTIRPDAPDLAISDIQVQTSAIAANGQDTAAVIVTVMDRFGNPIAGRPITLVTSRTTDRVVPMARETDDDGVQMFRVSSTLPGTTQLRALDLLSGQVFQAAAELTVGGGSGGDDEPSNRSNARTFYGGSQFTAAVTAFDAIDHFEIMGPNTMQSGVEQNVTIRAVDQNGSVVRNYLGTVIFESTDPNAILPGRGTYTFKSRDQGEKKFPLGLAFNTGGQQILRAYDKDNASPQTGPYGEFTVTVDGSNTLSTQGIRITSFKEGDTVNSTSIVLKGVGPRFANVIVTGGAEDVRGSTDGEGLFAIPVILNAKYREFTLRVRDDLGRNDSGDLHLLLDNTAPTIGQVTFAPEHPVPGEKILAVVQTENALPEVTLSLTVNGTPQTVKLTESAATPGTYQGFVDAPQPGVYQPLIAAKDGAGNTSEVRSTLTIKEKELPKVQNLRVTAKVNAVDLAWDPLNLDLIGYRVYVGESTTNLNYSLDTGRVTTKATVAGLSPGKTYVFAVTALQQGKESREKSDPVSASPLGMKLEVLPLDSALIVRWTSLSSTLPIDTFTFEYGTDRETFTERRTLNGKLREYTVKDLLNGVPYYFRVTPITLTGDAIRDLSATGNGTPNGSGFVAGPHEEIPTNLTTEPTITIHPGAQDQTAPTTPDGGSLWTLVIAATALGCLGLLALWYHTVQRRRTLAFLRSMRSAYDRSSQAQR